LSETVHTEFPDDVHDLKRDVLSWIAVIYGQLFYYTKRKSLLEGWLVFEDFGRFNNSLQEALSYLQGNGKIIFHQTQEMDNVGFCKILYQEGGFQMAKTGRGGKGGGGGDGGWIGIVLGIVGALATVIGTAVQTGKAIKGDRKLKKKLKDLDEMLKKGQLSKEEYNKLRERLINESQTHEI
jgi:hypothetical protein